MWGWIKHVIGVAAGAVDDTVRHWVADLISGVFGFIHTVFGLVGHAWIDIFHAAEWVEKGLLHLGLETYLDLWHILKRVIPDVIHWANVFIHNVWRYAQDVFHWAVREFDFIRHWVAALVQDVRRWVVRDIWSPIWRTLNPVWRWVTHEGATLWHYLTHPAALVDLLWNHLLVKMEREAWVAGRLLGRFFLSLVIHHVKTFAILIEDIVDAIL
jgi:hypothetical protein